MRAIHRIFSNVLIQKMVINDMNSNSRSSTVFDDVWAYHLGPVSTIVSFLDGRSVLELLCVNTAFHSLLNQNAVFGLLWPWITEDISVHQPCLTWKCALVLQTLYRNPVLVKDLPISYRDQISVSDITCFANSLHYKILGYSDGLLKFIYSKEPSLDFEISLHSGSIRHIQFAKGGSQVFVGSWYGTVHCIDIASRSVKLLVTDLDGPVFALRVSREYLFTSCGDGVIRLWNLPEILDSHEPVKAKQCKILFHGHQGGVTDISVQRTSLSDFFESVPAEPVEEASSNESHPINRIFSASYDGTIRVWDISSRKCVDTISGHRGPIWSLTSLGKFLFSASADGTCRVWELSQTSTKNGCAISHRCVSVITPFNPTFNRQMLCLKVMGGVMFVGVSDGQIMAFDVSKKGVGNQHFEANTDGPAVITKALWTTGPNKSIGGVRRIDVFGDRLYTLSVRGSISIYQMSKRSADQ
jgi:WD40 repeat protein